jgi:hypothetical protein
LGGSVSGLGVGLVGAGVVGFDLAWPPALVEVRLEWAVEAQEHEPALALGRLDPVALRVSAGRSGLNVTVVVPSSFAVAAGVG